MDGSEEGDGDAIARICVFSGCGGTDAIKSDVIHSDSGDFQISILTIESSHQLFAMAFDLINQILRDPNILMNDEANWQASRVRMAIEQIPEGIFSVLFSFTQSYVLRPYVLTPSYALSLFSAVLPPCTIRPTDGFAEKFVTTVKKPAQLRIALFDWAKRQNGRLAGDGALSMTNSI